MKKHPVLAGIGLLLALMIWGCNATPAPEATRHSRPEARPATRDYQPQATAGYDAQEDRGYERRSRQSRQSRRERRGRSEEQGTPGQFDFYLFNLSWSPEFCATHGTSPECGRNLGFVVHGLWPQDDSGDYPQHCSNAPGPANPQADTDIMPTASLVEHEWETHGTCSGLGPDEYFGNIHKAFSAVKLPANIGSGGDADGVSPDELLTRFATANPGYPAGSFALSCGNNRLTAVEICLGKDLRPQTCQGVRSCRANVVKVTPRS